MPVRYAVVNDGSLIVERWTGAITRAELLEQARALARDALARDDRVKPVRSSSAISARPGWGRSGSRTWRRWARREPASTSGRRSSCMRRTGRRHGPPRRRSSTRGWRSVASTYWGDRRGRGSRLRANGWGWMPTQSRPSWGGSRLPDGPLEARPPRLSGRWLNGSFTADPHPHRPHHRPHHRPARPRGRPG
jgi:hypothetical protein